MSEKMTQESHLENHGRLILLIRYNSREEFWQVTDEHVTDYKHEAKLVEERELSQRISRSEEEDLCFSASSSISLIRYLMALIWPIEYTWQNETRHSSCFDGIEQKYLCLRVL